MVSIGLHDSDVSRQNSLRSVSGWVTIISMSIELLIPVSPQAIEVQMNCDSINKTYRVVVV
jgi:hypothetical protein